jgi:hypothetical protein
MVQNTGRWDKTDVSRQTFSPPMTPIQQSQTGGGFDDEPVL